LGCFTDLGKEVSKTTVQLILKPVVGQVANLRPIVNRPAGSTHNAGERPHRLWLTAIEMTDTRQCD